MKFEPRDLVRVGDASRPARGAWIEIQLAAVGVTSSSCRAPQGARGLKCDLKAAGLNPVLVAPRKGRVD